VQLFRETPEGKEKTINLLKSGQTMCEGEILDACPHHRMSAVAVDDVSVMEFTVTWFKEAAKKYNVFALNVLTLLSEQVHMVEVEAEHQVTMSASQQVACFLQRLCVLYDFDPRGFDLPYSKTLIASRLGMKLETLSRTLSTLRENGIVVEGARVEIHNLQRVEQFVCATCSVAEHCSTHKAMEHNIAHVLANHKEKIS
jgi:CRP/FNR family transcriptional regulator, dissimilatory nitrate respiration regulator